MDFFEVKESSRRFGLLFGSFFGLIMAVWSGAVYLAFCAAIRPKAANFFNAGGPKILKGSDNLLRYDQTCLILTLILLGAMLAVSLWRVRSIRAGGSTFIATRLGGYPLELGAQGSSGPVAQRERMLANIVSEMAVAASIPEPDVYVLPREEGINAMAAGLSEDDVAVIVTLGALRRLDRDELAGVIGHEFSHILNGDMRRFTLMAGWLHGLFTLQMLARRGLGKFRHLQAMILVSLLLALGALGYFLGRICQAAFSRSREILADATSAQFTRQPKALARALIKIGGLRQGSQIKSADASGLSHFFLAKPEKISLFSSHPRLADRIWELDPSWDGWYHDFVEDPVDFLPAVHPGDYQREEPEIP
jgi:Zn-dependent protease with chaperone function